MRHIVPFLPQEEIVRNVAALLAGYKLARGVTLVPPIPIEDIIEKYLKLRIDFDDMHARHNVPRPASGETDILGAIYGDGSIFIDESLDPEENPSAEGRYRFTLAHEGGGHWNLHRHLIVGDRGQSSLLAEKGMPAFLCRSSEERRREEWQADFYASCLLMPPTLIRIEWAKRFRSNNPFVFDNHRHEPRWNAPKSTWTPLAEALCEALPYSSGVETEQSHDFAFNSIAREFAQAFKVSTQAMRIRLEHLGLLLREWPAQASLHYTG